jgi:hypothetical protein
MKDNKGKIIVKTDLALASYNGVPKGRIEGYKQYIINISSDKGRDIWGTQKWSDRMKRDNQGKLISKTDLALARLESAPFPLVPSRDLLYDRCYDLSYPTSYYLSSFSAYQRLIIPKS